MDKGFDLNKYKRMLADIMYCIDVCNYLQAQSVVTLPTEMEVAGYIPRSMTTFLSMNMIVGSA